jgi:hypothetical protein
VDLGATGEVNAEVGPHHEEEHDRDCHQNGRNRAGNIAFADKVDLDSIQGLLDEFHG